VRAGLELALKSADRLSVLSALDWRLMSGPKNTLPAEEVVLPQLLNAAADIVGHGRRIEADLELRELAAAERRLVAVHVAIGDAQLGREPVGPARVELEHAGIELLDQLIAVREEAEGRVVGLTLLFCGNWLLPVLWM
jgi:hypothetical protein